MLQTASSVKTFHLTLEMNSELVEQKTVLEQIATVKVEDIPIQTLFKDISMQVQARCKDLMTASPVLLRES